MLKLQSVSKEYTMRGQTVRALDDVTLEIKQGDFVSVVGPSGSGKSTLLLVLGGMLSPAKGRVLVEGESIYELGAEQRAAVRKKKIGFVFQTFNLVPYLTAIENVQIPLFLAGRDEAGQCQRATELLGRVGLADRLHHKPSELSIGQQQRVALARMLANDPAVILADEPTGNLDPYTARTALDFLEKMNQEGRTIVMVTHDMAAARRAKRTLKLVQGRINAHLPEDDSPELAVVTGQVEL